VVNEKGWSELECHHPLRVQLSANFGVIATTGANIIDTWMCIELRYSVSNSIYDLIHHVFIMDLKCYI